MTASAVGCRPGSPASANIRGPSACEIIGRPDLRADDRFIDQRARVLNCPELTDERATPAARARPPSNGLDCCRQAVVACLAYMWEQVVDTALFAENGLAFEVGTDEDAIIGDPHPGALLEAVAAGPQRQPASTQRRDSGRARKTIW